MKRKQELITRGEQFHNWWSEWRLELINLCDQIRAEWLAARRAAGLECRAPSEVVVEPKKYPQAVLVSDVGLIIHVAVGPTEPPQRLDQLETRSWDCATTLLQWTDALKRAKELIEQKDLVAYAARVD